ncbi:MAG: radical SAM protein [Clostridia bacterium]|nr:radical SAM protein [Clostridia bacterium]
MSQELCKLCPRRCMIDRAKQIGFCGASSLPTVSKVMLHRWEEPCICYGSGSGAIFFSGCQLKCVFCQNYKISNKLCGKETDSSALSELFFQLEEKGACNINLVSPSPYLHTIVSALERSKKNGLSIPILYNSGGYESVEALKKLDGLVDIYLPDFKFYSPQLSLRYAKAPDYAQRALEAIGEMHRQTGKRKMDGERLLRGIIIRHLILPGCTRDSLKILEVLANLFPKEDLILSLMRQYTPMVDTQKFPELSRAITSLEYSRVVKAAQTLGFENVYTQSKESSGEQFVPDFSVFFDETN